MATLITFPGARVDAVEDTTRQEFQNELSPSDIDEVMLDLKPIFQQLPATIPEFFHGWYYARGAYL